jgi:AraC family transcriptional regulator
MLSYSLRANAALRTKGGSAFERSDSRRGQSAVVLSMDAQPLFGEKDKACREDAVAALALSHGDSAMDRGVSIFPSNATDRHAVSWNGGKAEVVQVMSCDRTEFGFRAPFHLLIAYEQGTRRDGEAYVEGLPTSKLREVRRRLTFVPAGHEYREWHEARAPARIAYLYFDPANLLSTSEAGALGAPFAPLLFVEDLMVWEWSMKVAAMVESGSANPRYCEALVTVLAHEIVRLNAESRRSNLPLRGGLAAWQQRIVTTYIEEHLAEPISLTELAQLVRLSAYHFCRSFKKSFGVPPHRYHNIRRIERAKCLLAEPGCSVTEIGLTVGFSETSSFTAAFRRMTGSTPTSYRRSIE